MYFAGVLVVWARLCEKCECAKRGAKEVGGGGRLYA